MLEKGEQAGGERGHEQDGAKITREGVALAAIAAEIDEVVPEEKETRADTDAARGNRHERQVGMRLQPFKGQADEQIIHPRTGDEPNKAGADFLAALGRVAIGEVFHSRLFNGGGEWATIEMPIGAFRFRLGGLSQAGPTQGAMGSDFTAGCATLGWRALLLP